MPRYVWINDSKSTCTLDDSNGSELTPVVNNPPLNLTLINIDRAASGNYTCRTTHTDLPGINRETIVTVYVQPLSKLLCPKYFTFSIISDKGYTIVTTTIYQSNDTVSINCSYDDESVGVKWEHNNAQIDPNSDPHVTINTQSTYSELAISPLAQEHAGQYQCIVSNMFVSTRSEKIFIVVQGLIIICLLATCLQFYYLL